MPSIQDFLAMLGQSQSASGDVGQPVSGGASSPSMSGLPLGEQGAGPFGGGSIVGGKGPASGPGGLGQNFDITKLLAMLSGLGDTGGGAFLPQLGSGQFSLGSGQGGLNAFNTDFGFGAGGPLAPAPSGGTGGGSGGISPLGIANQSIGLINQINKLIGIGGGTPSTTSSPTAPTTSAAGIEPFGGGGIPGPGGAITPGTFADIPGLPPPGTTIGTVSDSGIPIDSLGAGIDFSAPTPASTVTSPTAPGTDLGGLTSQGISFIAPLLNIATMAQNGNVSPQGAASGLVSLYNAITPFTNLPPLTIQSAINFISDITGLGSGAAGGTISSLGAGSAADFAASIGAGAGESAGGAVSGASSGALGAAAGVIAAEELAASLMGAISGTNQPGIIGSLIDLAFGDDPAGYSKYINALKNIEGQEAATESIGPLESEIQTAPTFEGLQQYLQNAEQFQTGGSGGITTGTGSQGAYLVPLGGSPIDIASPTLTLQQAFQDLLQGGSVLGDVVSGTGQNVPSLGLGQTISNQIGLLGMIQAMGGQGASGAIPFEQAINQNVNMLNQGINETFLAQSGFQPVPDQFGNLYTPQPPTLNPFPFMAAGLPQGMNPTPGLVAPAPYDPFAVLYGSDTSYS